MNVKFPVDTEDEVSGWLWAQRSSRGLFDFSDYWLEGEVTSPGAYAIDGNETVLDAILLAGGLTSSASPCDIVLVRPTSPNQCRVVLPVCYRQLTQIGDATTNYQVQPGDRVVVGARTLCEELAFWNQRSSCEGCACSHCVECAPATVNYTNRIMHFASHFSLPRKIRATDNKATDKNSGNETVEPTPAKNNLPNEPVTEPASASDKRPAGNKPPAPPVEEAQIFLPPIESNGAAQKPNSSR